MSFADIILAAKADAHLGSLEPCRSVLLLLGCREEVVVGERLVEAVRPRGCFCQRALREGLQLVLYSHVLARYEPAKPDAEGVLVFCAAIEVKLYSKRALGLLIRGGFAYFLSSPRLDNFWSDDARSAELAHFRTNTSTWHDGCNFGNLSSVSGQKVPGCLRREPHSGRADKPVVLYVSTERKHGNNTGVENC